MTNREAQIVKAILDVGHEAEGGQFIESQLHGAANLKLQEKAHVAATLQEFNAALELIGTRGWMSAITSPVTGKRKWNISDKGESARLEF